MIVKVLIDTTVRKLNKVYDYFVPQELESKVQLGMRVYVNFGNGKGMQIEGIIVKIEQNIELENEKKLKKITDVLDTESYLDATRLRIGKWISRMYFCNVYDALKLMLPPGTRGIDKKKDISGKQVTAVKLLISENNINMDIDSGKIFSPKHIRLLRFLQDNDFALLSDIIEGLGVSRAVVSTVEKNGYIELVKVDKPCEKFDYMEKTSKLIPTAEQAPVISSLNDKLKKGEYNVSLIHGVTGSGKTEIYLQVIEQCLSLEKTAIVLVPEISLTYQTKQRFISRFGDVVSVLHSKMTISERQSEWKKIVSGKSKIVIGPRSALFVPLNNIGLIVIDEEHDSSYSSQTTPKYIAREVADYMAKEYKACLILGTATPDITTMYKAKSGRIDYYSLMQRPGKALVPETYVVDMKEEMVIGNKVFSTKLKEEINKNLENKEQTFLFLNRRGFASYLSCSECGTILKCRNCDVNLTYHKKSDLLLCHYCSYVETKKNICPVCGSNKIQMGSAGTQNIEEQIKKIFPDARVVRMDMDSTMKRGAHEEILENFKNHGADILIGTQMISKGHDIENVTLVGIINVDGTLVGNDYMTTERAFQNLLQVSGRAGRGNKKGRVVIQTYDTESVIVECLKHGIYMEFYEKEIEYRKMLTYPPFTDILLIELSGEFKNEVVEDSKKLYDVLVNNDDKYIVYSPKSPFVQKVRNRYRVQIILKLKINNEILDMVYEKLKEYDRIKHKKVGISITKNPNYIG